MAQWKEFDEINASGEVGRELVDLVGGPMEGNKHKWWGGQRVSGWPSERSLMR